MSHARHAAHGLALPTLMGLLAMASLATLLAMRHLWVNELLLNAEADQLRTRHKAQAVLPLAVQDIVGPSNAASSPSDTSPTTDMRHTVGTDTQTHVFFPSSVADYPVLRQRLGADICRAGICAPTVLDASANTASYWKANTASAMPVAAQDMPEGAGTAGYWVEVWPRTESGQFIYRITVLTNGVLPGSSTVLQAIWTRPTPTATSGQWQSWHVLHN
ncbi:hypothetical protein [Limnohabitans sp.]|uniref:hypothetical protein n=1 Tax=Limnohabitans sp. TaxID=1907725 RepID=UPI00286F4005|nr:hypothetical protein [Limnohabitans sp.]